MLFSIQDVHRLQRTESNVFYSIKSLYSLKYWDLPILDTDIIDRKSDLITVIYDQLYSHKLNEIQVTNPSFLHPLPSGEESDEYLILFVISEYYLSDYVERQILSYDFISRLIEKRDKPSSNSTKLMTLHSLQNILKRFDDIQIERVQWPELVTDLIKYLKKLIEKYPNLGYLPVSKRKKIRKVSISDTNIAWGFYVYFFIEEWNPTNREVRIPDLSKCFTYERWTGDFFDRDNPFWKPYLSANGKFRFNDASRDAVYQIWKEWVV
ncbi:hypothetical protein [Paenibacillus sp. 37]|uniref:hypothetical protein n=1 Tax=Paenibacillus sp. 37 TaxID=2607911 RepID=UPI00122E7FE1|nr:hypothetical protein [Paenibacillus sp. 37]